MINDSSIEADVQGTELYHVSIGLHNGEIESCHCSCPRYAETKSCKHIAATYLAYEEKIGANKKKDDMADLTSIVKESSNEKLVSFILEEAKLDGSFRQKASLFFLSEEKIDEKIEICRQDIEGIIASYGDFISYKDYSDFLVDVEQWFSLEARTLIGKGNNVKVTSFFISLLPIFDDIQTDADTSGDVFEDDLDVIGEIIPLSSPSEQNEIYDILSVTRSKITTDYLVDDIVDFLTTKFTSGEAKKKALVMVNGSIENAKDKDDSYTFGVYVFKKYSLLKGTDGFEEARRFITPYLYESSVYFAYVESLMNENDFKEAINTLRSLSPSKLVGYQIERQKKLELTCYEKLLDRDNQKRVLHELLNDGGKGKEDIVAKLRLLDSKEEWMMDKESIMSGRLVDMAVFYEREAMKEDLFCEASLHPSCYAIKRHFSSMLEISPSKIKELFFESLGGLSEDSSYHHGYEEIASYLSFFASHYKGGEADAISFAKTDMEKYKRRYKYVAILQEFINNLGKK